MACRSASRVQYSLSDEGADFAFALDDDAEGNGLDAAGGETAAHFVPEERRDLVAHQAVEHAAGLLGIDQIDIHHGRASRRPSRWPSW